MRRGRGQALVEFALVMPLLALLLIGGLALGLAIVDRYELQHAATEGAIAGADQPGTGIGLDRARCTQAFAVAVAVLGRQLRAPAQKSCRRVGRLLEVTLAEPFPMVIPFMGNLRVGATARSEISSR